jgi:bifunctional non-homologous end joining protein LigD
VGAGDRNGKNAAVGLGDYQSMRDFDKTAEPSGHGDPELSEHERNGRPRFVVQEHHATALHWDFRLEKNGVLVSWAVPRGLPPDPRTNHLAVHTEDHPLSYFDFEGEIPKGEYGGGKVMLWDKGTYTEEKFSEREVMVVLHGERTRGRHVLFKTGGKNWMIHRMDPPEDPSRELIPSDARPLEPQPGDLPAGDEAWQFAVAWNGTRVAIAVDGGRCTARTADGGDVTKKWPELGRFGRAVGALPIVLTGVLVRPKPKAQATIFLEDVIWLDGHPTDPLPFSTRRGLLDELGLAGEAWKPSPLYDDGAVLLAAAAAQAQLGILGFRTDAPLERPRLIRAPAS